jgi:uncharacterized protein YdaU (DUF1376 family)
MAKDPAFLMYPGDWNLGTMHMTLLEKGCYMELLMLQFARGKFTYAHAKHMLNGSFDLAWATVKPKFSTDGEYYWNERLKLEVDKRAKFTESRRSNALIKKKTINTDEHMHEHMLQHMENENINKDIKDKIEGMGEREGFDTMPKCKDINDLPELKIGAAIELFKITKQTDVTKSDIKGLWNIFKEQNLTGHKYYKNLDSIYSHFINWIKTQKIEKNGTTEQKKQRTDYKSAGANLYADRIKAGIDEVKASRKDYD